MKTAFARMRHPLLLACATYPVAVVLNAVMIQAGTGQVLLLIAAYLLLAFGCLWLLGRRRMAGGLLGCAALLALGAAILPVGERPFALALPIGYGALLMIGLPAAAWPREKETHAVWPILGLAGYVLVLAAVSRGGVKVLFPPAVALPLRVGFVLLLTLSLLMMNRINLQSVGAGRREVPVRVRRRNTVITLAFLALGLALSQLPGIVEALRGLWHGLLRAIKALAALLMALLPESTGSVQGAAPAAPEMMEMLGEAAEPGALAVLLERFLSVLALVALAVLVGALARIIYKKLRALARRLAERWGRFAASASEDYTDEVTDTREEGVVERVSLSGLRRGKGMGSERLLPPRERIRRRYLRLRRRHPEWHAGWTARETIPEAAAERYERARYSGHEITEEDASAFMEGVRRL